MLADMRDTCKKLMTFNNLLGYAPSVGQFSKGSKKSKSTERRRLMKAESLGLVVSHVVEYKRTGVKLYSLTEKGYEFLEKWGELL